MYNIYIQIFKGLLESFISNAFTEEDGQVLIDTYVILGKNDRKCHINARLLFHISN